jgi:transcriptional regulator with XRE-family HTH domain
MTGDVVWQGHVKGLLKAELKRKGITYKELANRLTASGTPESEANLANKISRGSFSAAFLLQCLNAMGCNVISVSVDA